MIFALTERGKGFITAMPSRSGDGLWWRPTRSRNSRPELIADDGQDVVPPGASYSPVPGPANGRRQLDRAFTSEDDYIGPIDSVMPEKTHSREALTFFRVIGEITDCGSDLSNSARRLVAQRRCAVAFVVDLFRESSGWSAWPRPGRDIHCREDLFILQRFHEGFTCAKMSPWISLA